jgi:hypothetical protein
MRCPTSLVSILMSKFFKSALTLRHIGPRCVWKYLKYWSCFSWWTHRCVILFFSWRGLNRWPCSIGLCLHSKYRILWNTALEWLQEPCRCRFPLFPGRAREELTVVWQGQNRWDGYPNCSHFHSLFWLAEYCLIWCLGERCPASAGRQAHSSISWRSVWLLSHWNVALLEDNCTETRLSIAQWLCSSFRRKGRPHRLWGCWGDPAFSENLLHSPLFSTII